jgi:hypothetical protein
LGRNDTAAPLYASAIKLSRCPNLVSIPSL